MSRIVLSRTSSIAMLLLCAGFVLAGSALFQTLLPLRADQEQFSTTLVGLLGTAYFAGFVVGCFCGPVLISSVGHIRCFAGSAALFAALTLVFPLALDPYAWGVLRFLTGVCLAVLFLVAESWLNDQSGNEIRGRVLSIYIIVGNIATMIGQLMVNLEDTKSQALFSFVAMLVCISIVPLALTPTTTPKPIPSAKLNLAELLRVSPAGAIGCLLVGMAEGAFWSLGPVFGQQRGMDVLQITVFMAAFVLGGTISQWPLGRLSDSIDRRLVIICTALGTVVTGLVIAFWEMNSVWLTYGVAIAHGGLMVPLYALCLAHANDNVANNRFVEISGGLLLLYSAGAMLGPPVAALVMQDGDPGGLFVFVSAVLGVLAVFLSIRLLVTRGRDRVEAMDFMPVPKTSPSVYALEAEDEPFAADADTGKIDPAFPED